MIWSSKMASGCSVTARSTGSSTTSGRQARERLFRGQCRFPRGECEAAIPVGGDLIADVAVSTDAADIWHEHLRLAGDVDAHVPGIRQRIERLVRHLVAMRHPVVLRRLGSLDGTEAVR